MFSSRAPWELRPNRISSTVESLRRSGVPLLDLTESNPTRAGFEYPASVILGALSDARSLRYDPMPAGLPEARARIADYYASRGYAVAENRILLTSSTSESYSWLFKLLCNPNDEILVPRPSYPLFEFLAALECVRAVQYPLSYHGRWSLDVDVLEDLITPRTRAILLVNPNNPTGSFLKQSELAGLASLCGEHGLALVSDEVFADYTFGPDANRVSSLVSLDEVPAFCLSGLSKVCGLPQMKLGWMVVAGPQPLRPQALERLELIADTYLSVGTPVQHAAPALLEAGAAVREGICKRVRQNRDVLQESLAKESALRLLDVEGGWYGVLQAPRTRSEEEWTLELLERDSVLVQPGYFYDFTSEAYLILSFLTPPDVFGEGVRRILARCEGRLFR
ncbi:MAG: pyridoxal phosphate-dependent aminotransferase [Bryobacteraceae bacterium]